MVEAAPTTANKWQATPITILIGGAAVAGTFLVVRFHMSMTNF
jgi:hypothetical protein